MTPSTFGDFNDAQLGPNQTFTEGPVTITNNGSGNAAGTTNFTVTIASSRK